jgi:hypothetical protein
MSQDCVATRAMKSVGRVASAAFQTAVGSTGWVKTRTPRFVGELSTYLIGAGAGAWLAWIGAVQASFAPHKLHYWSVSSKVATAAIVVGLIARWLGSKEDPRIKLLGDQVTNRDEQIRTLHGQIERKDDQIDDLNGHIRRLTPHPTGALTEAIGTYAAASVGATGPMQPSSPGSSGPQGSIGPSGNTGLVGPIVGPMGPTPGPPGPTGPSLNPWIADQTKDEKGES